jgi:hypothetical protein
VASGDPTPGSARIALIAVIVLLAAVLGCLVGLALMLRRRGAARRVVPAVTPSVPAPIVRTASPSLRGKLPRPSLPRMSAGGGLAVASSGMVCPTCRTEYDGQTFCTRDARRLVPAEEMLAGLRSSGGVCTSCRRAFEPGLRRCPSCNGDIIPATLYQASRSGRRARPPSLTGVNAKICPACRGRYDLATRFCGQDGTELVVVN